VPARVHIFGNGPRLRALCAALVRAALPEAAITEFADEERALEAARRSAQRTIVLDARVAPEERAFTAFADARSGVGRARGFDGTVRAAGAALIVDSHAAPTPSEPPIIGDWLDDPEPATPLRIDESVEVHSPGFGFGGYASAARNTIVGLHRAGVRVAWRQFSPERESVDIDAEDRALLDRLAQEQFRAERALLIHLPTHISGQLFLDRYIDAYVTAPYACYTMFETDAIPARWPAFLARAGRVWVPSRFNVETFASAGVPSDAIEYVPLGLEVERFSVDGDALDVPGRRGFAFLSVFGFTSRKGWDVLVEAWARAFDRDDDVSLILRTGGPDLDVRAEIAALLKARGIDATRLAPIVVLEQALSARELAALYRSADAFVLPSRGEGVGLPYLEAMAFGLPAIGTAWSGATEFLNAETGYPIECGRELVDRMTARAFPLLRDQQWAAPSVEATARCLRDVFEDRAAATLRAARGCALARTQYNRIRTGRIAAQALQRIGSAPRRRAASRAAVGYRADFFSIGTRGSSARAALGALERAGVPVAAVAEGVDQRPALFLDDARLLKTALARPAQGVRASIVQVDAETIEVSGSFGTRRLRVPPAIDVERWTPQLGGLSGFGPARTMRFLTTAQLDERSGYDRAVGAFLRAFEPGDDAMLVIKVPSAPVDPAHAQGLIAAAAARHAPHRAPRLHQYRISVAAGIVPEGDYMQMLGSFDAYVHVPSIAGSSRALLEAMASALACIRARSSEGGIERSETTAFLVEDDLDDVASAIRSIARDPAAAATRGHAARRVVVARHGLDVVGQMIRTELEALAGAALIVPGEPAPPDGILGIIVDERDGSGSAADASTAMTHREHRIVVLREGGPSFDAAAAQLEDCRWIAYLRGDARVTPSWDVVLADALDSRPLVKLVVPRIVDAPASQGFARPQEPFADFVRGLTVTQIGRGAQPASIVTTCILFDPVALLAALRAAPGGSIEVIARVVAAGGKSAWCAFDTAIERSGTRPWPLVALG